MNELKESTILFFRQIKDFNSEISRISVSINDAVEQFGTSLQKDESTIAQEIAEKLSNYKNITAPDIESSMKNLLRIIREYFDE